jgi:uncharacterized protein (TIGR02391 family)
MAIEFKTKFPCFDAGQLEGIAKVIGDTCDGLTHSEIGDLLANSKVPEKDEDKNITKWKRLLNAFIVFQNEHQAGNHVIVFLNRAMNIARYTNGRGLFKIRQEKLNQVLSICGYEIRGDGKVHPVIKSINLDEAISRANHLKSELERRNVHQDVLIFCDAELLQDNYFHAVLEAVKSITSKIRKLSGFSEDGAALADKVFGGSKPLFVINSYDTETLKGEQCGFVNLLKGLYGTIRNPLAHEPKIEWAMSEQDALDIFCLISLIHRKLDNAKNIVIIEQ